MEPSWHVVPDQGRLALAQDGAVNQVDKFREATSDTELAAGQQLFARGECRIAGEWSP